MRSPRSAVFCDYLNISVPESEYKGVMVDIQPVMDAVGIVSTNDPAFYRVESGRGGLRVYKRSGIYIFSGSGGFMESLREAGELSNYLMAFASRPHRPTSADFTVHEYVSAPEVLAAAYQKAVTGGVAFTRKAIKPRDVRRIMSPVDYDQSGRDTGTVYLGRKGIHDVFSKMYDKRQEVLGRYGLVIPDTVCHELTVTSAIGFTLRDVYSPESCFYHFYPPNLLSRGEKPAWESQDIGFTLSRRERLPAQVLKDRVEKSGELAAFERLADTIGVEGRLYLLRLLANRLGYQGQAIAGLL